jgi:hypothetical protein
MSLGKTLAIVALVALAASGCRKSACQSSTVLVSITLGGSAASADSIEV